MISLLLLIALVFCIGFKVLLEVRMSVSPGETDRSGMLSEFQFLTRILPTISQNKCLANGHLVESFRELLQNFIS